MAQEKSVDARLAEIEAEKLKLEAEKEALRVKSLPQYPKWIADPADETGKSGRPVETAEEEKAVLAGYAENIAANKRKAELDKKIANLREKAEKEAAATATKKGKK